MHLTLLYVVLVYHQYNVCKYYVGSVHVGGFGGLIESRLGLVVVCNHVVC